jgi:MFS family permease
VRRPWPLRGLLAANAISIAGTAMTLLALPWFVLVTTGSPARTGIVAACEAVPLALATGVSGPLVDRLGARRTAVLSDLLSALAIGAVPVLHASTGLRFWQLCVLVAALGLVRAPGETARYVLLPGLVELARTPVERAVSAYDGVSRGARMVGAPLAGAAIALLGAADVLLLDAGTFVVSALMVLRFVPRSERVRTVRPPYLHQLRDGLGVVRRDALLRGIVLMVMGTNLLDAAWGSVLLPVYAREVLGSSVAQGLLVGVFGVGALSGTVIYGVLGPRLPRWPVYTAAFLICGSPRLLALATDVPLAGLVVLSLVCGLGCGALNPVLTVVELERVPVEHRASVYGVSGAGALIGMPAGAVLAGFATQWVGVHAALLVAGLLYLAVTLVPVVRARVWRQMDATRPVRAPAGATMAA